MRSSSSFSASKYSVVTSYKIRLSPPVSPAWAKHLVAIRSRCPPGPICGEVALKCPVRHHLRPEISQHPQRVGLAGWLGDPGDHQVPEHRIVDHVEAEPVIQPRPARHTAAAQARPHRAAWPGHPRRCLAGPHEFTCTPVGDIADTLHRCRHLEVEHLLTGEQRSGVPVPEELPARHRYAQNPHARPAHHRHQLCALPAPPPRPRRCALSARTRTATYPISKPNDPRRRHEPAGHSIRGPQTRRRCPKSGLRD